MAMIFTRLIIGIGIGLLSLEIGTPPSVFFTLVASSIFPDLDVLIGEHRKTLHHISLYIVLFFASGISYLESPHIFMLLLYSSTIGLLGHYLLDYCSPFEYKNRKASIYSRYHNSYVSGFKFIKTARVKDLAVASIVDSIIILLSSSLWIIILVVLSIISSYCYSL
jgi:ABC-type multidrug transport system permease subunit